MAKKKRTCRYCGEKFEADRATALWCSVAHRQKGYRERKRLRVDSEHSPEGLEVPPYNEQQARNARSVKKKVVPAAPDSDETDLPTREE